MTLQTNVKMTTAHTTCSRVGRGLALIFCALGLLSACRGDKSTKPPIHLNRNMDTQDKYKPQRVSKIFKDGRAMRPPVEGAVGRDLLSVRYEVTPSKILKTDGLKQHDDRYLQDNDQYWRGGIPPLNDEDSVGGKKAWSEYSSTDPLFVSEIPSQLKMDQKFIERGQERYNIYCTPCHGVAGYGNGTVAMKAKGAINVPSYHQDYMRSYPAGWIYGVIANGSPSGIMMGYKHQIPTKDRWAIVAYVRALQRSQLGYLSDNQAKTSAGTQGGK